jgi:hypothetical protein
VPLSVLESVAWADARVACADWSVTSKGDGSIVASSWPLLTWSPTWTSTALRVPAVLKPRFIC